MEDLSFIKSIILGIFQGLTEFLPVSSSGHVMLLSEIFGLELEGSVLTSFTVLLHVGTLLAVALMYFKRVIALFAHPIKGELKWLIIATLPTVIYELLLKFTGWDAVIDASARTLLPFAFLFTAVLMLLSDGLAKSRKAAKSTHSKVRFVDALKMGLMQCVGTFAGVSRSGSTIAGGLASGLNSKSAADFSFMMSMPAICGGAVLDLINLLDGSGSGLTVLTECIPQVATGIIAAFAVGILAIRLMVALVKKAQLKWFALYLTLLAAAIIVNDYITSIW